MPESDTLTRYPKEEGHKRERLRAVTDRGEGRWLERIATNAVLLGIDVLAHGRVDLPKHEFIAVQLLQFGLCLRAGRHRKKRVANSAANFLDTHLVISD